MVRSTQIARVDGLALAASVDDEQVGTSSDHRMISADCIGFQTENELTEPKSQVKQIFRRLNRNSEPQASIECGTYTLQ